MEGRSVSRSNDVWDAGLRLVALLWLWDLVRVCAFQEKASKQDSQARAQSVVVACGIWAECCALLWAVHSLRVGMCWQVSRRAAAADGLPVQAARRGLGALARDASVRSQQPLMF